MRKLIIAAGLAIGLTAGAAQAGPLAALASTKVLNCREGVVPAEDVIFALMNSAGVPQSSAVYAKFKEGKLGDYMNQRLAEDEEWRRVRLRARSLIEDGPGQPEKGYALTVVNPPPDPATALMNGDVAWLRLTCSAPQPSGGSGGGAALSGWVIAKALADADKPTKKRGFATISYVKNYESKEEIVSTELFIGLPSIESGLGPGHTFRPYLGYQRRTGDEPLNDLTFGASSRWFVDGDQIDNAFFLNGEYETDDDLKSEAYRAEFIWEPVLENDPCGALTTDQAGFSCILRAALDTQQVEDPGEKTALQDKPSFTRYGGDFRFSSYWELAAGGSVHLDAMFAVREPFSGKNGDAAFGQVGLKFVPAGLENISFGVEYFEGEDLTSLERDKTLKFAIGFRN